MIPMISSICYGPLKVCQLPRTWWKVSLRKAGLLDDDPGIKPDKHIFVEHTPAWDDISDDLPRFTRDEIYKHRTGKNWPL